MTDANQSDAVVTNQQDTALLPVTEEDWNNPNLGSLINLLLREGLHSGVWFADRLLEAAKFLTDARHRLQSLEQPKPSGERQEGPMALIEVERNAEGEVMICTGCGTVETVRSIRARRATAFTCCPERKMVRAADFGDHGAEQAKPSASGEAGEVERVARAIQDVKGGINYDYADFCRDAARAAIAALSERGAVGEEVAIPRALFDFLMGCGEIDGSSFSDLHESLPGRFWWRALLRACDRAALSSIQGAGDEG